MSRSIRNSLAWVVRVACVLFLILTFCAAADRRAKSEAITLWTAEVLSDSSIAANPADPDLINPGRAGISFLGNDTLVVFEVDKSIRELSSRQSASISSAYKLRASTFDIASGRQLAAREWPTKDGSSLVRGTRAGLLLRADDILGLYSKDLRTQKEKRLKPASYGEEVTFSASPDGQMVAINRRNDRASEIYVLDGLSLEISKAWRESPPLRRLYSVSNTGFAAADFNQENILYKEFGAGPWRRVAGKPQVSCVGLPTLVTDSTLVNGCKPMSYVNLQGDLILKEEFGKDQYLQKKTALSWDGMTAAFALLQRAGGDFWDTGAGRRVTHRYVVVYDLAKHVQILTRELSPIPLKHLDFALSPDGTRLAILADRRVTVLKLR